MIRPSFAARIPMLAALLLGAAPAGAQCPASPLLLAVSPTPLTTGLAVGTDFTTPRGFVGSGTLLKAFDPLTGAWLWTTVMSGEVLDDPLPVKLDGGLEVVLVALSGCRLACVNAADGSLRWDDYLGIGIKGVSEALGGAPAVQLRALSDSSFRANVPADLVFATTRYTPSSSNRVYALYAKDGSSRWTFSAGGTHEMEAAYSGPVVDLAHDLVYVGTDRTNVLHNSLWAFRSIDGGHAWQVPAGRITQRPLLAGGRLYTAGADAVLRATDPYGAPGSPIWSLAIADAPVDDPVLVSDSGSPLVSLACAGDALHTVIDEGTFSAELPTVSGVTSSPRYLSSAGRFFTRITGGAVQEYDAAVLTTFGYPALLCGDPASHLTLYHLPTSPDWQLAVTGSVGSTGFVTELCVPWGPNVAPGGCTASVVTPGSEAIPHGVSLAPPSPNPTSSGTRLVFTTSEPCRATVLVTDLQGRRVARLVEGAEASGERSLVWDGHDEAGRALPSGLYTVRLLADGVGTSLARTVLVMR